MSGTNNAFLLSAKCTVSAFNICSYLQMKMSVRRAEFVSSVSCQLRDHLLTTHTPLLSVEIPTPSLEKQSVSRGPHIPVFVKYNSVY